MASKYRSGLEKRVASWMVDLGGSYETHRVPYVIPKKYTPDFTFEDARIHVEIKGWFRPGDRQKYVAIKEAMWESGWDFVFILQNPNKPVSKGAKSSMADWCDKQGITWFSEDDANGFELYMEDE